MGLQEDIQQRSFRSEHQKLGINIIYSHHWLSQNMRTFLKGAQLTSQQYNVLRILRGSRPEAISTLQIRQRMLDKMSDSSRIVDRLVAKGLAQKQTNAQDKRLVDVEITEQGLRILAEIDEREKQMDVLLGGLSSDEAEQLNYLLDKMRSLAPELVQRA